MREENEIKIIISRSEILNEVAKVTDYVGSLKVEADEEARDRILADDETLSDWSRFFDDAFVMLTDGWREMVRGYTCDLEQMILLLEVNSGFDREHIPAVKSSIESFLINAIVGMWFGISNPDESEVYLKKGADFLDRGSRLLYGRRGPVVPKR